jgi:competence protein ComEA
MTVLVAVTLSTAAVALACPDAKPDAKKVRLVERVDINRATRAELMKLAGVDAGMADRIIAYRAAHGPFRQIHELEKVPRIGRAVIAKNAGRLVAR